MRTNRSSRLLATCLLLVVVLLACRPNPAPSETDIPTLSSAVHSTADTVNVTAYGARPNDGVDDTAAIQQAIDSGEDVVYVPPGEFLVTRLELGDGQTLMGAGMYITKFKLPDNMVAPAREVGILGLTYKDGAKEVAFRNFEYDGNAGGEGNRDWLGQVPYGELAVNGISLGSAALAGSYPRRNPPRLAIIENVFIHDTARNGIVWRSSVQVIGRNWHIRNSDGDHLVYDTGGRESGTEQTMSEIDGVILEGHARGPLLVSNSARWSNVTFRNVAANPAPPTLWTNSNADQHRTRARDRDSDRTRDRNRGRTGDRNRDRTRNGDRDRARNRDGGRARAQDRDRDRTLGPSDRDGPYRTQFLISARSSGRWGSSFENVSVEGLDPSSITDRQRVFGFVWALGSISMTNVDIELIGDSHSAFHFLVLTRQSPPPSDIELDGVHIANAGPNTRLLVYSPTNGAVLEGARFNDVDIEYAESTREESPLFELAGPVHDLTISNIRLHGGTPILIQFEGDQSDSFTNVIIENVETDALGSCFIRIAGGTMDDVSVENITIPPGSAPVIDDTRRSGSVGSIRVGQVRRTSG